MADQQNENENKDAEPKTMHLRIVSAEKHIFSGSVRSVALMGIEGALGIYPGHSPLLTFVGASNVVYMDLDGSRKLVNVYGGILEVQPQSVSLLVDTAIRGDDIDESLALESKRQAEEKLAKGAHDKDYYTALTELSRALSKLRAIELTKKFGKQ